MDLCDDAFSRSMGLSSSSGGGAGSSRESESADEVKSCAGCQTTKTPLWRGGPTGPKSLCNACGIRYSKNRRTSFGPKEGGSDGEKKQMRKQTPSAVVFVNQGRGLEVSLKLQVLGLGSDAILNQRSMIQKQRRRMMRRHRRFGEVERAAKLLMALSSGVLYA